MGTAKRFNGGPDAIHVKYILILKQTRIVAPEQAKMVFPMNQLTSQAHGEELQTLRDSP